MHANIVFKETAVAAAIGNTDLGIMLSVDLSFRFCGIGMMHNVEMMIPWYTKTQIKKLSEYFRTTPANPGHPAAGKLSIIPSAAATEDIIMKRIDITTAMLVVTVGVLFSKLLTAT